MLLGSRSRKSCSRRLRLLRQRTNRYLANLSLRLLRLVNNLGSKLSQESNSSQNGDWPPNSGLSRPQQRGKAIKVLLSLHTQVAEQRLRSMLVSATTSLSSTEPILVFSRQQPVDDVTTQGLPVRLRPSTTSLLICQHAV